MHIPTGKESTVALVIALALAFQYIIAVIAIAFFRARCWNKRFTSSGIFRLCKGGKIMCGNCPYNPSDDQFPREA